MDFLDEAPDSEAVDSSVKPGTIRIILADSQAIYRVGIRKVFALEDDLRVATLTPSAGDGAEYLNGGVPAVGALRAGPV